MHAHGGAAERSRLLTHEWQVGQRKAQCSALCPVVEHVSSQRLKFVMGVQVCHPDEQHAQEQH